jgi:hypothetical protein
MKKITALSVALLLIIVIGCKQKEVINSATIRITMPDKSVLTASINEKETLSLLYDSVLYGVSVAEVNLRENMCQLNFMLAQQVDEKTNTVTKENIKTLSETTINLVRQASVSGVNASFEVQLISIAAMPLGPTGAECCVTCNGGKNKACGCAVDWPGCGTCCRKPCCPAGQSPHGLTQMLPVFKM